MRFLLLNFSGVFVLALCLLLPVASGQDFVGPEDVVPPFRRDRLPMSVDRMMDLSASFALLPRAADLSSPGGRRAAAQSLALAVALNPENEEAIGLINLLGSGGELPVVDVSEVTGARAQIWQARAWLEMDEAGEDGNLLADLITDTMVVLDSEHPVAKRFGEGDERGQWDGWVGPISDFEDSTEVGEELVETKGSEEVKVAELSEEKAEVRRRIKLKEGELGGVVFQRQERQDGEKGIYELGAGIFTMRAEDFWKNGEGEGDFQIVFDSSSDPMEEGLLKAAGVVRTAVEAVHGGLPEEGRITISMREPGRSSFERDGDDLTGPGFVLAESAISGVPVGGTVTVIGKLNEAGELVLPDFFWRDLLALKGGDGGRLVIPTAGYEYLEGFLALEMPDFFLNYEVLLAEDVGELVRFCAVEQAEGDAEVFGNFQLISQASEGQQVGIFVANRFVRQRLIDLAMVAPFHASARLLAIQGAGDRPRVLGRKLLAAEIWRILEPLPKMEMADVWRFISQGEDSDLDGIHENLVSNLEGLERYLDSGDRDLFGAAESIVSGVKEMIRAAGRDNPYERDADMKELASQIRLEKGELLKALSEITGDPMEAAEEAR